MIHSRTFPSTNLYLGIKGREVVTNSHICISHKLYLGIKGREGVTNSHMCVSHEFLHIYMHLYVGERILRPTMFLNRKLQLHSVPGAVQLWVLWRLAIYRNEARIELHTYERVTKSTQEWGRCECCRTAVSAQRQNRCAVATCKENTSATINMWKSHELSHIQMQRTAVQWRLAKIIKAPR